MKKVVPRSIYSGLGIRNAAVVARPSRTQFVGNAVVRTYYKRRNTHGKQRHRQKILVDFFGKQTMIDTRFGEDKCKFTHLKQ